MVTDEHVEKTLNRFGQTITDLPKSKNDYSNVYEDEKLLLAKKEAMGFVMDEWRLYDEKPEISSIVEMILCDYICHQSDVIERLLEVLKYIGGITH